MLNKINIFQKGKVMALFVVLTFAVAILTAVTFLSESFVVVVAQSPKYDPNACFKSNSTINTCPTNSNIKGLYSDPMYCFKTVGETNVGAGEIQNWTKSIQNFNSLIPGDSTIALINTDKNIVGGGGPITDMAGIWDVMKNGNMTRHDRQAVLDEVNSLLAAAKPGFTKIQQDALSTCIIAEANSLGPTPNY
jgi:hypothetical protein